jgi:hypothetical protein
LLLQINLRLFSKFVWKEFEELLVLHLILECKLRL